MKKTSIICLIFFTLLSLYASSISQKEIKSSPEHKFKLWLNDTVKHIKGKYTISYDSTLLTITDSFSYIVTRVRDKVSMQTVLTALIFQHKQAEPQVYCQKSNRLLGQNIGS